MVCTWMRPDLCAWIFLAGKDAPMPFCVHTSVYTWALNVTWKHDYMRCNGTTGPMGTFITNFVAHGRCRVARIVMAAVSAVSVALHFSCRQKQLAAATFMQPTYHSISSYLHNTETPHRRVRDKQLRQRPSADQHTIFVSRYTTDFTKSPCCQSCVVVAEVSYLPQGWWHSPRE